MKTLFAPLLISIAPLFISTTSVQSDDAIAMAVADAARPPAEKARDAYRKPVDVLTLLGVEEGDHIADIAGGSGYYSEILSTIVGKDGKVSLVNNHYVAEKFPNSFGPGSALEKRRQTPKWQSNITVSYADFSTDAFPSGLDGAMMVLFYHDTIVQKVDRAKMNKAIYDALKPGAAFVVIDHSAAEGSGTRDTNSLHRVDEAYVVKEVTAAGFTLVKSADYLAHPEDTRDYPFWRDRATKRDQTDRFVLKFVKPE